VVDDDLPVSNACYAKKHLHDVPERCVEEAPDCLIEALSEVLRGIPEELREGHKPDKATLGAVVHACAKAGDIQKAEGWLAKMQERGISAQARILLTLSDMLLWLAPWAIAGTGRRDLSSHGQALPAAFHTHIDFDIPQCGQTVRESGHLVHRHPWVRDAAHEDSVPNPRWCPLR